MIKKIYTRGLQDFFFIRNETFIIKDEEYKKGDELSLHTKRLQKGMKELQNKKAKTVAEVFYTKVNDPTKNELYIQPPPKKCNNMQETKWK